MWRSSVRRLVPMSRAMALAVRLSRWLADRLLKADRNSKVKSATPSRQENATPTRSLGRMATNCPSERTLIRNQTTTNTNKNTMKAVS